MQFLWRSVCGCIFQGNAATNYGWSDKFKYVYVGRQFLSVTVEELLKLDSICERYPQMKKGPVFLPRDAMQNDASAALAVMRCLSVRRSVTFVHSVKTNKHNLQFFSPSGSPTILVFFRTKRRGNIPTLTVSLTIFCTDPLKPLVSMSMSIINLYSASLRKPLMRWIR